MFQYKNVCNRNLSSTDQCHNLNPFIIFIITFRHHLLIIQFFQSFRKLTIITKGLLYWFYFLHSKTTPNARMGYPFKNTKLCHKSLKVTALFNWLMVAISLLLYSYRYNLQRTSSFVLEIYFCIQFCWLK